MQGTVTKRGVSKNGKPTLHVDGKLYFAGKCDVSELSVGDKISFEAHAFSDDGQLWTIDKWGKLPQENGSMRVSGGAAPDTFHPYAPPVGGSLDEPTLRFISNCVGSAISAKTLTEPEDIEKWVSAARNAIRGQS